jgi:hypothetical protein
MLTSIHCLAIFSLVELESHGGLAHMDPQCA